MVPGKVRKYRSVKLNAENTIERQRVRGHFHGGMRTAALLQLMQHAVQIERLGRCIHCRSHFSRYPIFNGPHQQRGLPGGSQNRVDQESSGGFPIGPRHPRQAQPAIRLSIEVARGQRQRAPSMLHLDPQAAKIIRRRKLACHGHRAFIQRGLRKLPAVGSRSRKREEQEAWLHAPRVVLQAPDFHSSDIFWKPAPELNPAENLFERHGGAVNVQIVRARFVPTAGLRRPREPVPERFRLP